MRRSRLDSLDSYNRKNCIAWVMSRAVRVDPYDLPWMSYKELSARFNRSRASAKAGIRLNENQIRAIVLSEAPGLASLRGRNTGKAYRKRNSQRRHDRRYPQQEAF